MSPRVPSVAVLDGVLTRRVGSARAVTVLTAERVVATGTVPVAATTFAAARRRAERVLPRLRGRRPELAEVYAEVARVLGMPADRAPAWAEAELALERELVVPVPGAARRVAEARSRSADGSVTFVSDTPHPAGFVHELLQGAGLLAPGDAVRTGDDAGRVRRPRSGRLTRYERLLEDASAATGGLTSWLAGAARLARLRAVEQGTPPDVAAVAAGVVAPLVLSYVLWAGARARRSGVRRLHFVARDGEVLLGVARPVLAALVPEVECRYLYGSRQSWLLAASSLDPEVLTDWLAPKPDATLRTALARVGMTPQEVWDLVTDPVLDPARADRLLDAAAGARLSSLLRDEPLAGAVARRAREHSVDVLAYLRQEGLTDGVPSALVDAGWRGHAARAFDRLVAAAGGGPAEHWFVGLFDGAQEVREAPGGPSLTAWLFDRALGTGAGTAYVEQLNVVVEVFLAGSEGRVLRFGHDEDGTARPVLAEQRNTPVLDWGLCRVRAVVDDVVQQVLGELTPAALHQDLGAVVWRLLEAFWMRPTHAEARAWGSFPWEEETDPPFYPVAEAVSTRVVLRRLVGAGRTDAHARTWPSGSRAVTGGLLGPLLRARRWQRHAPSPRVVARRLADRWAERSAD